MQFLGFEFKRKVVFTQLGIEIKGILIYRAKTIQPTEKNQ